MPCKKDTETFIAEARAVHGNRYDYSRVVYAAYRQRVEIVCRTHGVFLQTPALHTKGRNCRKCAMQERTKESAVYCRFCGVRVMYLDAIKKRCQSPQCSKKHSLETGRKIGCQWADVLSKKWHKEHWRQKRDALPKWEKKCNTTWIGLWSRERWRDEKKAKQKTHKTWQSVIAMAWHNARREADESAWDDWKLKVVRFCREATQGRRNMASRMGKIKRNDLLETLKQQSYRCALSGWELTPETAQIDHKDPVSKGGKTELANLQWLHEKINRMKGSMSQEEFVQICKLIADHPPTPGAV